MLLPRLSSLLICLSSLVVIASSACFDNGDKEIGGRCYKFVAQKLTFDDARNWCHYQNPVTASYLAYVPNQIAVNFLASYARSAFATDDGEFWIGLSRDGYSSPWRWDNGAPFAFSNFQTLAENYAAESIVNGRWNGRNKQNQNYFVCSYDPAAPPTFPPNTMPTVQPSVAPTEFGTTGADVLTTSIPVDPLCFPLSDHTLLFAYSNDLDPQVVKHSLYWVIEHSGRGTFSKFGSIRFDTKNAGNFSFFNDLGSIQQSVYSNLPDPSLGFSDDHTGSDILNVLQRFLENTNGVPLCGSLISILLKRHPMETYSSDLLAHLRYHHIFVRTLMSNTPILGENSQIMYNLSGLTNGMAGFLEDQHMGEDSNYFSAVFYDVFQIYSINPIYKSGMERTDFPILQFPKCNYSEVYTWIEMSVQDHGPLDKFRSFNLTLTNTKNSGDQINVYSDYTTFGSTNFFTFVYLTQSANYSVKLLLEFSDSEPENLQFRIWTGWEYDPIDYWLPFTNWN